jgi:hypothetical protein
MICVLGEFYMLEKLLLAGSITIALQFCVSLGAFSPRQTTSEVVSNSPIALAIEVQLAQILH